MKFLLDNDFKTQAIDSIFEILTETGSIQSAGTTTTTYASFLAPIPQIYRRYKKFHAPEKAKHHAEFNDFVHSNEFQYNVETIRELLQISPANVPPNVIIQSRRLVENNDAPHALLQEWYNDNHERVQNVRVAIMEIVTTAISVAWSMHLGMMDSDTRINVFFQHDSIVELIETDELLFKTILGTREIENILYGVLELKSGGDAISNAILKKVFFDNERDLWKIVEGRKEFARHTPGQRQQPRQVLRETNHPNVVHNNEQATEDAVNGIQTSACLERICHELLRQNLENERVCQVALERLVQLLEGNHIRVAEMIQKDVAEPILDCMKVHAKNQIIQQCGVLLLWRAKSRLPKLLPRAMQTLATCAICTAMEHVPDDVDLQLRGLDLICMLQDIAIATDSMNEFCSTLVETRALYSLTSALENHQEDYDVAKSVFAILGSILGGNNDVTDSKTLFNHEHVADFVCNEDGDIRELVLGVYELQKEQGDEEQARRELKPLVKRIRKLAKLIQKKYQEDD